MTLRFVEEFETACDGDFYQYYTEIIKSLLPKDYFGWTGQKFKIKFPLYALLTTRPRPSNSIFEPLKFRMLKDYEFTEANDLVICKNFPIESWNSCQLIDISFVGKSVKIIKELYYDYRFYYQFIRIENTIFDKFNFLKKLKNSL